LKILAGFGIDGSVLEQSSPDDLVIISFSGHGWADPQRNFYMLPSDAVWPELPEGDARPDGPLPSTLVNMDEMTTWLRIMDAADIVLIIDACHAGASVETPNFKAGPLGDRGLGQLAYDKGIKILVATQAEDVAVEDSKLRHGLLTYALAGPGEGLVDADGMVDGNQDGRISLDEWINYPIYRLPTLNEDRRVTGGAEAETSSFRFPGRVEQPFKKVQQPTLFDYGNPSRVILRGKGK
jgi:Caspase domain